MRATSCVCRRRRLKNANPPKMAHVPKKIVPRRYASPTVLDYLQIQVLEVIEVRFVAKNRTLKRRIGEVKCSRQRRLDDDDGRTDDGDNGNDNDRRRRGYDDDRRRRRRR